jgi:hypothetical protein
MEVPVWSRPGPPRFLADLAAVLEHRAGARPPRSRPRLPQGSP